MNNSVKNIVIILLLFFSSLVYSQNKTKGDEEIIGVIITNSNPVIITNSGYYKLESKENDKWLEYYQKIYNDTTITNPNTEIKSDYSFNIIPYLVASTEIQNQFSFEEPLSFGLFFQLENNEQYYLSDYGKNILDSLQNIQR
jgi:hypothetical protein